MSDQIPLRAVNSPRSSTLVVNSEMILPTTQLLATYCSIMERVNELGVAKWKTRFSVLRALRSVDLLWLNTKESRKSSAEDLWIKVS